jgi:hypothetical protein
MSDDPPEPEEPDPDPSVKDYAKIAMLSRITGASPFDVAMGMGALTFWASYSRRSGER